MPCAEWELVGGLRERGCGGLRGAGAVRQGIGALTDGGKRRRGGLGAAGDRTGRALELANHAAEFELQELKDFLGRIAFGRDSLGQGRRRWNLGFDGRRSRFRHSLSKQTERHRVS